MKALTTAAFWAAAAKKAARGGIVVCRHPGVLPPDAAISGGYRANQWAATAKWRKKRKTSIAGCMAAARGWRENISGGRRRRLLSWRQA
jgi:ketopantoate hydroxymethyltransferase